MNEPSNALTVRSISARAVSVPMARSLWTSAQVVREAPLLLVDLHTEEGVVGHAYLFCYLPAAGAAINALLSDLSLHLRGQSAAPVSLRRSLSGRFRLLGQRGIASMAAAAIDMAAWDALARAAGLPLARILGAEPRPIRAYNSTGLGLVAPDAAAREAVELLEGGFGAIKMRLGRADPRADLEAVRAVRRAIPENIRLMSDYNQALSPAEALERCRSLDSEGLFWIEEPIRHDDYRSYVRLKESLSTPVQIGENFAGPKAMESALSAQCTDFVMPDVERIGGVSGWMEAAALAASHDIEMSSHLFPEISAHLLSATPTSHWLEYVDWASPVLKSPPLLADGSITPSEAPGCGIEWDEEAVARYLVK